MSKPEQTVSGEEELNQLPSPEGQGVVQDVGTGEVREEFKKPLKKKPFDRWAKHGKGWGS